MPFDIVGIEFLAVFCLFLPWLCLKSARALNAGHPFPSRRRYYTQTLLMLGFFFVLGLATAKTNRIPLFPPAHIDTTGLMAGISLLAITLGSAPLRWRAMSEWRRRRLARIVPTNAREWIPWIAVSLAAGFSEEVVYRGVMTTLFARLTGNYMVAIALTVVAFSVAHAIQGWTSAVTIGLLSIGLHALVWLTSSLYVSIAVHSLYDLFVASIYLWLGIGNYRDNPVASVPT